jgi:hypothetical protein
MIRLSLAASAAVLLSIGMANAVPISPAPIFGAVYEMKTLVPDPYAIGDITYLGVKSPPPGQEAALSVYHTTWELVGGGGVFAAEVVCLDPWAQEDLTHAHYYVPVPMFIITGPVIAGRFGAVLTNGLDDTASNSSATFMAGEEVVLAPLNIDLVNGPLSYNGPDPTAFANAVAAIVAADTNAITQPPGTTSV